MAHIEEATSSVQFVCSSTKKNIFLIGDSIRLGYCSAARDELSDVAEVFYVDDNCRNTQYVLTKLYDWASMFSDTARVDVVQFNCGHWDTAHFCGGALPLTSEDEYKKNLQMIINLISKLFPNAKIVFATTTTVNPSKPIELNPRTNADIVRYNDIAKAVAGDNNVAINDLFPITEQWNSSYYEDACHFTEESNRILGKIVADRLKLYF